MPEPIHIGYKEAMQIAKPYGIGEPHLRKMLQTVPGLRFVPPGRQSRGLIVRARLLKALAPRDGGERQAQAPDGPKKNL